MPKRWRIASYDAARVDALGRAANVPHVVAQLLLSRGICDADGVRQFLDVRLSGLRDPEELPGAVQAAEILHAAIRDGRRITVYGDYDADGMTATAILLLCLKLLGAKADFYIPNRIDEGYGLNHDALRTIAGQGGDIVITVDCGITSVAEAETARQLGLTLIITDHHQPHAPPSSSASFFLPCRVVSRPLWASLSETRMETTRPTYPTPPQLFIQACPAPRIPSQVSAALASP
jgi:single-stranded-DNA-specific exonuclease